MIKVAPANVNAIVSLIKRSCAKAAKHNASVNSFNKIKAKNITT